MRCGSLPNAKSQNHVHNFEHKKSSASPAPESRAFREKSHGHSFRLNMLLAFRLATVAHAFVNLGIGKVGV